MRSINRSERVSVNEPHTPLWNHSLKQERGDKKSAKSSVTKAPLNGGVSIQVDSGSIVLDGSNQTR